MRDGSIGILNVGAGDTKLTFDRSNPAECIRAARIVRDMLRRGYALLIQVGASDDGRPKYARARDFDENTFEYIIADFDPLTAAQVDATEAEHGPSIEPQAPEANPAPRPAPAKRGRPKRIDAATTTGVAVARTAGG